MEESIDDIITSDRMANYIAHLIKCSQIEAKV
jgi:hypothetical protein